MTRAFLLTPDIADRMRFLSGSAAALAVGGAVVSRLDSVCADRGWGDFFRARLKLQVGLVSNGKSNDDPVWCI